MGWETFVVVIFELGLLLQGLVMLDWPWMNCFPGGYNLHRCSDALDLV